MKKILILLVAALAISFAASSSSFAQQEAFDGNAAAAQSQGGKVIVRNPNTIDDGQPGTGGATVITGEKIKVYRKTCRGYRCIGCICVSKLCCLPPGDDYILVKKHFGKYCWVKVCCCKKDCGC